MTEEQMITHVTQIHDAQKKKKAEKEEEALVVASMKEKDASVQAKDVDGTIVHGVIIDLTNTSIMDKTPKASNAAITIEVVHHVQERTSKNVRPSSQQPQMKLTQQTRMNQMLSLSTPLVYDLLL